jgi:two-component system, chemotaxis family, CheB/CheR fusion protein
VQNADRAKDTEAEHPRSSDRFSGFVVAVGASAGGLEALERLFRSLPIDTGAAFVVVQHLAPDHKSMMDQLLARHTAMPVKVVEQETPLRPNTVHLIPPACTMTLRADRLLLAPKPEHGLVLPIDIFFASAAEQIADRTVAIVLSGTGSDGSRGITEVNAAGGIVLVQEPGTARFDGMPRSAVATGYADGVAPIEQLAALLVEHLRNGHAASVAQAHAKAAPAVAQPLDGILSVLLDSGGIDFRDYKPTIVLRRIERRMQLTQERSLQSYLERLQSSADEQTLLRREMLIPVTRFFRDGAAFDQIADEIAPAMLQQEPASQALRVWCAACSTGEEAYSLAIVLTEAAERLNRGRPIKIFATDVEPRHLETAAAGWYASSIAAEVSPARLERFFEEANGGWQVRPQLRQTVIFARHNLLSDPPFTNMHLVTCRNALIYLQPAAQELTLRRLQFALKGGGCLLLGPSESLGAMHTDFAELPGRNKLYRLLRQDRRRLSVDVGLRTSGRGRTTLAHRQETASAPQPAAELAAERLLREQYVPPSILVGAGREVLRLFGNVHQLLRLPESHPSLNVLKLLPRELGRAASVLLQAVSTGTQDRSDAVVLLGEGPAVQRLLVVARRLAVAGAEPMTLLSFEVPPDTSALPVPAVPSGDALHALRIAQLERDLDLTSQTLQAAVEEVEGTNEELQAANEELMASNEELQSTNEELQSVNEELYTVNAEFQEKLDVLNEINADLESITTATSIPTLFVDESLRLTRFTPEVARLIKVRDSDKGRSIEDFAHTLDYPQLYEDLRRVFGTAATFEREVRNRDGSWWLARAQPYAANSAVGKRAVMTFVNVTSLKDSQRLQAILDSLVEHVAVVGASGQITMINSAWRAFAIANGDPELRSTGTGSNYLEVCQRSAASDADARAAHAGLSDVLAGRREHFSLQYPCMSNDRRLWFLMQVSPIQDSSGGVVVSHLNITTWVESRGDMPQQEKRV